MQRDGEKFDNLFLSVFCIQETSMIFDRLFSPAGVLFAILLVILILLWLDLMLQINTKFLHLVLYQKINS